MKKNSNNQLQQGAAVVTLVVITAASLITLTALATLIMTTLQSAAAFDQSSDLYYAAESGVENALLRLLRDPSYTGDELTINSATVTITVLGGEPTLVTSTAVSDDLERTIAVTVSRAGGQLEVLEWEEQ